MASRKRRSPAPRQDNRVTIQQMAPVAKAEGLVLVIPNLTDVEYDVLSEACRKILKGLRGN